MFLNIKMSLSSALCYTTLLQQDLCGIYKLNKTHHTKIFPQLHFFAECDQSYKSVRTLSTTLRTFYIRLRSNKCIILGINYSSDIAMKKLSFQCSVSCKYCESWETHKRSKEYMPIGRKQKLIKTLNLLEVRSFILGIPLQRLWTAQKCVH